VRTTRSRSGGSQAAHWRQTYYGSGSPDGIHVFAYPKSQLESLRTEKFGIFFAVLVLYGNTVYFPVIWYVLSRFVRWAMKKLATLLWLDRTCRSTYFHETQILSCAASYDTMPPNYTNTNILWLGRA
jgi:hypothetical protein